tara:strand:+ start:11609 stop:11875 length:267 start_codon:yes stop_codon:yes gene_type:complete
MNKDIIVEEKNILIVIEDGFKKVTFDCPVCKMAFRGLEDMTSFEYCGSCKDCQDYFYWPNKSNWDQGWRPKKEVVHDKLNNYYMIKEK